MFNICPYSIFQLYSVKLKLNQFNFRSTQPCLGITNFNFFQSKFYWYCQHKNEALTDN